MLKKYQPIWFNTHFNHSNEITEDSTRACDMLADAGIPLGNQSVLIRGVNDCIHINEKTGARISKNQSKTLLHLSM